MTGQDIVGTSEDGRRGEKVAIDGDGLSWDLVVLSEETEGHLLRQESTKKGSR